jgi:hypothetical protein
MPITEIIKEINNPPQKYIRPQPYPIVSFTDKRPEYCTHSLFLYMYIIIAYGIPDMVNKNWETTAESIPATLAITVLFNVSQQVTIAIITPHGNPIISAPAKKSIMYTMKISSNKKPKQTEPQIMLFNSMDLFLTAIQPHIIEYCTLNILSCIHYYTTAHRILKHFPLAVFGKIDKSYRQQH